MSKGYENSVYNSVNELFSAEVGAEQSRNYNDDGDAEIKAHFERDALARRGVADADGVVWYNSTEYIYLKPNERLYLRDGMGMYEIARNATKMRILYEIKGQKREVWEEWERTTIFKTWCISGVGGFELAAKRKKDIYYSIVHDAMIIEGVRTGNGDDVGGASGGIGLYRGRIGGYGNTAGIAKEMPILCATLLYGEYMEGDGQNGYRLKMGVDSIRQ